MDDPFFAHFQLNVAGQKRHDDRFEETDRILGEVLAKRLGEQLLVAFFLQDVFEGMQGERTPAEDAFGSPGTRGTAELEKGFCFVFHDKGIR